MAHGAHASLGVVTRYLIFSSPINAESRTLANSRFRARCAPALYRPSHSTRVSPTVVPSYIHPASSHTRLQTLPPSYTPESTSFYPSLITHRSSPITHHPSPIAITMSPPTPHPAPLPSTTHAHSPSALLSALLHTTEHALVPLTTTAVASGSKLFGAAILSATTLEPYTCATNAESLSPLLHGEIACIQKFYMEDFPINSGASASASASADADATPPRPPRPNPQTDCVFFATHEPCSLCLSGIAWAGFREVYYMFTYEDSRDRFGIPYDIDILQEVYQVPVGGEGEGERAERALYNRKNKYFEASSLQELVDRVEDEKERERWRVEVGRVREMYDALSERYQEGKVAGVGSASTWK